MLSSSRELAVPMVMAGSMVGKSRGDQGGLLAGGAIQWARRQLTWN